MAMFVHLTPEKNVKAIQRSGITRLRMPDNRPGGIYAMPVTRNFYVSHQWLRELKHGGQRTIWAVYFRIPDAHQISKCMCIVCNPAGSIKSRKKWRAWEDRNSRGIE